MSGLNGTTPIFQNAAQMFSGAVMAYLYQVYNVYCLYIYTIYA